MPKKQLSMWSEWLTCATTLERTARPRHVLVHVAQLPGTRTALVLEWRLMALDDGRHKRSDISRLLRDDEVKDVVGKLKRV